MFIWRSILRLPENHATYAALVDKGTHPAFENMHEKYPIKSRKLLRVLQRLVYTQVIPTCTFSVNYISSIYLKDKMTYF